MDTEHLNTTDSGYIELHLKDYFLSQEEFFLKRNPEFGFLETHPRPENLNPYYDSEDYISHSDAKEKMIDKAYQWIKKLNIRQKFQRLKRPESGMKLLDYGCGTGDFLLYAKKKNWEISGVEPNPVAKNIAIQKLGKEVLHYSELKDIPTTFDTITLWHVLEHIPNLYEFIEELKTHLNPDGEIFIAVPNYQSFDAKFYKEYWAAYDVPRHLWHFSPESMQLLFARFGMKIENTYPLWFDSFYISLLSEKYKRKKWGFLRAILIALISNLNGLFTGNFSSLVYKIKLDLK